MQKLNLNKKIREKLQYNFANNNQEYSTKGFRFLKIKKILSPVPYLFLEYKKDQKKEKIIKRKKKYKAKINYKKTLKFVWKLLKFLQFIEKSKSWLGISYNSSTKLKHLAQVLKMPFIIPKKKKKKNIIIIRLRKNKREKLMAAIKKKFFKIKKKNKKKIYTKKVLENYLVILQKFF